MMKVVARSVQTPVPTPVVARVLVPALAVAQVLQATIRIPTPAIVRQVAQTRARMNAPQRVLAVAKENAPQRVPAAVKENVQRDVQEAVRQVAQGNAKVNVVEHVR